MQLKDLCSISQWHSIEHTHHLFLLPRRLCWHAFSRKDIGTFDGEELEYTAVG